MKILFIIETLGQGGAERVLVNTLPELKKIGIECETAILFEQDDLADELRSQNIKVHKLNLSYKWNIFEGVYKLRKLIKTQQYDIIHAHLFFAYFYTGLIKLFFPQIKTATTFHNLGYNTYPANTLLKKIRKRIDGFVVNKLIDRKVAVSSMVKKHYSSHLKIKHVDIIFNSFPLTSIRKYLSNNISRKVFEKYVDITVYKYFVVTPGRLVQEKGHQYLLDAIKKMNDERRDICYFIVGAGPLENEICKKISNSHLANVVLIPGLEQKDLFRLIQTCDLVVIPSVSEGFPMIVGECMALGKAIVATEISGIVDMIKNEKSGLLVPAQDSTALYHAIKRSIEDKILREKLSKSAEDAIGQFDTALIVEQWKRYYEGMLNG